METAKGHLQTAQLSLFQAEIINRRGNLGRIVVNNKRCASCSCISPRDLS